MSSTEGGTSKLDKLRAAVRTQGGDWNTRRAVDTLDGWPTPERARVLLNQLVDEGLLIKHGPRGRLWTQPPPLNLQSFVAAVAQQIRRIPGVADVHVQTPTRAVVKTADGRSYGIDIHGEPELDEYDRQQIRRDIRDDEPEGDQR